MGQWDLDLPSIYTPTFEDHPSPGSAVGSAWEMPKSFKYRGATGVARRGVCAGAMNAWAPHQHWSIMCTLIGAGAYMYMYNYTVYIYIYYTHTLSCVQMFSESSLCRHQCSFFHEGKWIYNPQQISKNDDWCLYINDVSENTWTNDGNLTKRE